MKADTKKNLPGS